MVKKRSSRRAAGEGSIFQRKDGRWSAVITVGYTPEGKRVRKSFYGRTQADVVDKLNQVRVRIAAGEVPALGTAPTLAEFLEQWLVTVVQPHRSTKTYDLYWRQCRNHILPALGGIRLDRLTPMHVQSWIAGLDAPRFKMVRGERVEWRLARASQRGIVAILQSALGTAVTWRLISRNPVVDVEKPKIPRQAPPHWDEAAARRFLDAARGQRLEAMFMVGLHAGLRLGELVGLQWSQVDLRAGTIQIEHQVREVSGDLSVTAPKSSAGLRTIPLPPSVTGSLRRHRERLMAEGLAASPYVFPDTRGGPLRQSNFRRRDFARVLEAAGVPDITPHGMRHTFATLLLASGVDVKTVSELLGHADPAVTLRVYAHALPRAKRDASDKLGALLGDQVSDQ